MTADPNDDVRYIFEWSNAGTDAALTAALTPAVAQVNTPVQIRGTVKNLGTTPLTAFTLYYRIDDSPEVEMQVSGMNLQSNERWDFTHDYVFMPTEAGRLFTVKMRIALDGGQTDENPSNDTLSSMLFTILGSTSVKRVLVEEFTGAWCGWCPDGAVQMEKLLQAYPLAVPVALHAGGTDAMITPESAALATEFQPSFPMAMIDRMHFDGEDGVPIGRASDAWITRTGEQFAAYTPLSVSVAGTHDLEAFGGYVDVDVEFSDFAPPADYRIHCWLILETVTGTGRGWDQANYYSNNPSYPDHPFFSLPNPVTMYEHRHVPIQMLTGAWGIPGEIPDIPQAATTYSKRFHFTQTGITESSRLRAVAFITRHNDNIQDRSVLNAAESELRVKSVAPVSSFEIRLDAPHPQPASSTSSAMLTLPRRATVFAAVYDLLGRERLLVRNTSLDAGTHALTFPTASLENGLYILHVQTDGQTMSRCVTVLHL